MHPRAVEVILIRAPLTAVVLRLPGAIRWVAKLLITGILALTVGSSVISTIHGLVQSRMAKQDVTPCLQTSDGHLVVGRRSRKLSPSEPEFEAPPSHRAAVLIICWSGVGLLVVVGSLGSSPAMLRSYGLESLRKLSSCIRFARPSFVGHFCPSGCSYLAPCLSVERFLWGDTREERSLMVDACRGC